MKLVKFTSFANSIYPHEIEYLKMVANFEDNDRQEIFNNIASNVYLKDINKKPYNTSIDKRKYSGMIKWIQDKLEKIDVDVLFNWMIEVDKGINFDTLRSKESKRLIIYLKTIDPTSYYFIRFYELVIQYRDYTLIRSIKNDYPKIKGYLDKYKPDYEISKKKNNDINNAAANIMLNNKFSAENYSKNGEQLLKKLAYDKSLDGFTRYKALIRLSYLYYYNNDFYKLKEMLNMFDKDLSSNIFYSKRILANYYNNVAKMYSKFHDYSIAERYGIYAIKQDNSDYLRYVNNLCGILLRREKFEDARILMESVSTSIKNNAGAHDRVGYVALYVKTLSFMNKHSRSKSLAETYISVYSKEILDNRWHLFFNSYIQVLLRLENYRKVISLNKKYNLVNRESKYTKNGKYLPRLYWYHSLAMFEEGKIDETTFINILITSIKEIKHNSFRTYKVSCLLNEISEFCPEIIKKVKDSVRYESLSLT